MSIPRRLGRLARGFVTNLQEDDRLRETLRAGRERGETLKDTFGGAFEAAWRGAAEEWRAAEEERKSEEEQQTSENGAGTQGEESSSRRSSTWEDYRRSYSSTTFTPRKFSPAVLNAYGRLDLPPGAGMEEISRKRRDLIKRYHPDRFSDPEKRARAERLTAEINAAHDTIARHLLRGR